jgi:hypothetical protein
VTIPGNVDLALDSSYGGWALVRAANGFAGFVDGAALLPTTPWSSTPALGGGPTWVG